MSKNTLEDLNDRLFAQLDRLDSVDPKNNEALMAEIARTNATVSISRMVVDNAALLLKAHVAREETFATNYDMPDMLKLESSKGKK